METQKIYIFYITALTNISYHNRCEFWYGKKMVKEHVSGAECDIYPLFPKKIGSQSFSLWITNKSNY